MVALAGGAPKHKVKNCAVRGRVIEPDGTPVVDFRVNGVHVQATDGRFQLKVPRVFNPCCGDGLEIRAKGFHDWSALSIECGAEVGDCLLLPKKRLRGRVTAWNGTGVADAFVVADLIRYRGVPLSPETQRIQTASGPSASASADADGGFDLDAFPGVLRVNVTTEVGFPDPVEIDSATSDGELRIIVPQPARLSGRILVGGLPLRGVQVRVQRDGVDGKGWATTNARGRYVVGHAMGGAVTLSFDEPNKDYGTRPAAIGVPLPEVIWDLRPGEESTFDADFALPRDSRDSGPNTAAIDAVDAGVLRFDPLWQTGVVGRVHAWDGGAVPRFELNRIAFNAPDGGLEGQVPCLLDPEGFETFEVHAPDYLPWRKRMRVACTDVNRLRGGGWNPLRFRVELLPRLTLTVQVTKPDGTPLAGANVHAVHSSPSTSDPDWKEAAEGFLSPLDEEAVTDARGRAVVAATVGNWRVWAEGPGYASGEVLVAAGPEVVALPTRKTGRVRGTVRVDGRSAGELRVIAQRGDFFRWTRPDPNGNFVLESLPPGKITLHALPTSKGQSLWRSPRTEINLPAGGESRADLEFTADAGSSP